MVAEAIAFSRRTNNGAGIASPIPPSMATSATTALPGDRAVQPVQPDPVNELREKVRAATLAGRVNFLPYLDPYTEETPQMRRMYPIMLRHPVVKQALATKVESVAQLPMQIVPASDSPRDAEISDGALYALTSAIDGEFQGIAKEILYHGLIYKNSVCELVWYEDLWKRGRFAGKRFFRALKAKEFAQLVQDEFRNIVGVRAMGFGQAETFSPDDFAIFRNFALFHGAGMSDFRAAYKPLWELDTVEKLHGIHLEKYLSPMVHASYGPAFDVNQLPALQTDLGLMRSRSWIATPPDVQLAALQMATRGESEYLEYCRDRREQIALSIAGAYLQMLTAGHTGDIRGDSATQKSTAELLVESLASEVTGIVNKQIIPRWVNENYDGADYPKCALGATDLADQKLAMDIVEGAQRLGFPVSKRAVGRQFALQAATDPSDTLQPLVQGQGQPPGGGGFDQQFDDEGNPRRFCGGPGGKPGPCATGRADDQDGDRDHGSGGAATAGGHADGYAAPTMDDLHDAEDDLAGDAEPAIEQSPKMASLSVRVGATVVKALKSAVISEFPAWAMEHADVWLYENAVNSQHAGGVMAGKVAAFAAVKAYNGIRAGIRKVRGFADGDDGQGDTQTAAKLHALMVAIAAETGWPVPSVADLAATRKHDDGRRRLDRLADRAGGGGVRSGRRRGVVARSQAVRPHCDRDGDQDDDRRRPRRKGVNLNGALMGQQQFDDAPPTGQAPTQIALHGADGAKAEQLLARAKSDGARVLAELTRGALRRLLAQGGKQAMRAGRLFSDVQRARLARVLTDTQATAHLLGQARIRRRADQIATHRHADNPDRTRAFSDIPTDLQCFDDGGPLAPMTPAQAVDYFKGLVPSIKTNVERFGKLMERQAFSLAVTTDGTLLDRVKSIIRQRLETGEDIRGGPKSIAAMLEKAGVAPDNPQYADAVFRTNMMDSYNSGAQREMSDLADIFPTYKYSNPGDSRSRPTHKARDGKYFSSSRLFADVRGTDAGDVINCRCTFIPIDKYEWADLQAQGASVERGR
jgi:SPP1 gp7 family putative phage head morphogenesis protein